MKISIGITEIDASDAARLFQFLAGSTATVAIAGPEAIMSQDEDGDDENTPPQGDAPAVDSTALPWDERIHSKNKSQNKDGTWRNKKGVGEDTIKAVEAELRAKSMPAQFAQAPAPAPVPQSPQPVQMPAPNFQPNPMQQAGGQQPAMPIQNFQPQPVQMPAPEQPATPAQNAQQNWQASPHAPIQIDFQAFMQHLAGKMQQRDASGVPLINQDYLVGVCQQLSQAYQRQVNSITDIQNDNIMITHAVQIMQRDGRW